MFRQFAATLTFIATAIVAVPSFAQTTGDITMAPTIATADVNGVTLHYEIHGEGAPLVMLHGGVNPSEMFGSTLTEMAKTPPGDRDPSARSRAQRRHRRALDLRADG